MTLAEEYGRQRAWRAWDTVLDALPSLEGATVLDLGCAVGEQAALLAARGARVIGVDSNEDLLAVARARGLRRAEFRSGDLRTFSDPGEPVDGVWCSLVPAYFPHLPAVLAFWTRRLRRGGWVALTEIDDLFAHQPLAERTRALLDAYAEDALRDRRYDFRSRCRVCCCIGEKEGPAGA